MKVLKRFAVPSPEGKWVIEFKPGAEFPGSFQIAQKEIDACVSAGWVESDDAPQDDQ